MTYAELLTARDNLEAALITYGGGTTQVQVADQSVTYASAGAMQGTLNRINRAIARHNQQAAGQTPGMRTASIS